MKTLILLVAAVLFTNIINAQKSSTDFVPLFDGKTLDGWKSSTDNPKSFSVQDGIIVCKGGIAHLFYNGKVGNANFGNFELKLKARTTSGSNSGVYFHTIYQEEGWPGKGFEAQVNSTHTDPIKTGSLYGIANIYAPGPEAEPYGVKIIDNGQILVYRPDAPSTDGEWFDYHIIVNGRTITLKVNGETTVEWYQPDSWANKDRRLDRGTVAFQAHDPNSETHYKDIQIKILD